MTPAGLAVDRNTLDEPARLLLEQALTAAVRGDVRFDAKTRAVFATDSSNYRQVPLGVVFPRDHDDVVTVLRVCAEHDAAVVGRGAGTSLAGQACNVAVVVDLSRYLTAILAIDPVARTARVQPGVVLDDLRRAAERHGLTFGPDPATHAWCTLGGMIGNNSCGTHGLFAGKTVDNVDSLRVVAYGGESFEIGCYDDDAYATAVAAGGMLATVLGGLREIGRRNEARVRERFPDIGRRVSGYNLDQVLPGVPLHAARLLVGTESTCVLVTEATLRLVVSPPERRLVVLGYPDIYQAADAVPSLLLHPLLGLEGFDVTLTDQMRAHGLYAGSLDLLPPGRGWLLAELGGETATEADDRTEAFLTALPADVSVVRADDRPMQQRFWAIRETALGATAIRTDGEHNREGWEDAAVAPERLGAYLRGVAALWQDYGYSGAWYGHFGQGCVHTRNNFDLHTAGGLADFRSFIERAADLVVSLGGSISGEHGDGQARGELLERMYGPELVDAFRQVKSLFDPRGRMNPGKLVDPFPFDTNLRAGPSYRENTRLLPTFFPFERDSGSLQHGAERCVGVGRCRRDDTATMCPSYRATRDEVHSTRGRAKLLVEMFQGDVTPATWRNDDVREALDLCLSCKGCTVDCPTHVDMATYKAEFLAHYYHRRLRPRAMYALGLIPWSARVATRVPRLANRLLSAPLLGPLVRRAAGVTTWRPVPVFAATSLRRSATARGRADVRDATVVVWPDTFTDAFRPQPAEDLIAVLESLGERVAVPADWACCGRPLYDMGMLALAKRTLTRLLDVLEPWIDCGTPVVVLEPSCLAAFRDELPALMAGDPRAARLATLARSPGEHLLGLLPETAPAPATAATAVVHPHCHQRALGTGVTSADVEVLRRLGIAASTLDAGCCGLAGSFGFDARHEAVSRDIGGAWVPQVRTAVGSGADARRLVVDGFSCAMQLDHLGGPPAEALPTVVRRMLRL